MSDTHTENTTERERVMLRTMALHAVDCLPQLNGLTLREDPSEHKIIASIPYGEEYLPLFSVRLQEGRLGLEVVTGTVERLCCRLEPSDPHLKPIITPQHVISSVQNAQELPFEIYQALVDLPIAMSKKDAGVRFTYFGKEEFACAVPPLKQLLPLFEETARELRIPLALSSVVSESGSPARLAGSALPPRPR